MLVLQNIWTAIDRGYEEMAQLQLEIAKKSRISGDVTVFNAKHLKSTQLLAYITALEEIPFNHTTGDNKLINIFYNNIKTLTKDLRRWD